MSVKMQVEMEARLLELEEQEKGLMEEEQKHIQERNRRRDIAAELQQKWDIIRKSGAGGA